MRANKMRIKRAPRILPRGFKVVPDSQGKRRRVYPDALGGLPDISGSAPKVNVAGQDKTFPAFPAKMSFTELVAFIDKTSNDLQAALEDLSRRLPR